MEINLSANVKAAADLMVRVITEPERAKETLEHHSAAYAELALDLHNEKLTHGQKVALGDGLGRLVNDLALMGVLLAHELGEATEQTPEAVLMDLVKRVHGGS